MIFFLLLEQMFLLNVHSGAYTGFAGNTENQCFLLYNDTYLLVLSLVPSAQKRLERGFGTCHK